MKNNSKILIKNEEPDYFSNQVAVAKRFYRNLTPSLSMDISVVAGGREMMFKERQAEIFEAGANAIVVGNYLTTSGREKSKDLEMLKNLGLQVASSPEDK